MLIIQLNEIARLLKKYDTYIYTMNNLAFTDKRAY